MRTESCWNSPRSICNPRIVAQRAGGGLDTHSPQGKVGETNSKEACPLCLPSPRLPLPGLQEAGEGGRRFQISCCSWTFVQRDRERQGRGWVGERQDSEIQLTPLGLGDHLQSSHLADSAQFLDHLLKWSPAFLAPGTGFVEDNFSTDQGLQDGFLACRQIQLNGHSPLTGRVLV